MKQKVLVVELPKQLAEDEEDSKLIARLGLDPGFQALCRRLAITRAYLKELCATKSCETADGYRDLQQAYKWAGWLEQQVLAETRIHETRAQAKPREAFDVEQAEFDRLSGYLEIVGRDKPSSPHKGQAVNSKRPQAAERQ
jgi:hypothetical protein